MKTKKFIFSAAFGVFATLLAACSGSELTTDAVEEGLPVSLQIQLTVPEQESAAMTRATDAVETSVEKLALVFYKADDDGYKPVVIELGSDQLGTPTQVSSTHYKYNVSITSDEMETLTTSKGSDGEGLLSGKWYLYAIANYDKQYVSITLDQIKGMTKADMDAYPTGGSTEQDIVETAVLMSAKYGTDGSITLNPGLNTLSGDPIFTLRRTVSKNIFNFKTGSSDITFTPTSYTLHNYSSTSTLFERGTRTTEGGYNIGVYDNDSKTVNPSTSDIAISGNTFTFYTQENAQKATTDLSSWTYNDREAHVSADNQNFKYAPSNATYVVVKGTYEGPISSTNTTKVKGDVTYTIHLGDFSSKNGSSFNNFSVLRNVKYTYTVTVNGVNNIVVEAQAEGFEEKQPGAEGHLISQSSGTDLTLDAHYEQVLLKFDVSNNSTYYITLKTPYTDKTIKVDELDADEDDYKWIEFGKPQQRPNQGGGIYTFQSYTTLKNNGKLCDIKKLVSEIQRNGNNSEYFIESSNNNSRTIYVAAYVNEYYYTRSNAAKEAKDLDYWEGCKGLSDFVNADNREMTLSGSVDVSADGKSSYTSNAAFSIKQRSIKCPFSLELDNPYGVETVEETEAALINRDNSNSYTVSKELDGWSNYTSCGAFTIGSSKWSTYINESNNGWIYGNEPSDIMNSDYSYAIYQCLSRNRDLNGNGVIDKEEIRWYLPAHNQCLYLWFGENSLPTETQFVGHTLSGERHYLTSTLAKNMHESNWWIDEGSAFGDFDEYKSQSYSVRAVRTLGTYNEEPTDICSFNEKEQTVQVSGLDESCMRASNMTGNYAKHAKGEAADKLPAYLKIAKTRSIELGAWGSDNLTKLLEGSVSEVSEYSEDNDAGYWRIPNEKELSLIEIFRDKLTTSLTGGEGARTSYVGTNGNTRGYFYNGKNICTSSPLNDWSKTYLSDQINTIYIRPVRDASSGSAAAKRHRK